MKCTSLILFAIGFAISMAVALTSCESSEVSRDSDDSDRDDSERHLVQSSEDFETLLLRIALEYESEYQRVPHLASANRGRIPRSGEVPIARREIVKSTAESGAHAGSIFVPWVKFVADYTSNDGPIADHRYEPKLLQPVKQAIVFAEFHPENIIWEKRLRESSRNRRNHRNNRRRNRNVEGEARPAVRSTTVYYHGRVEVDPTALYILTKLDPETPGTDQGWVYGVVSGDGQTVKAAGRVKSCMGCHMKAANDRVFGMAKATRVTKPKEE